VKGFGHESPSSFQTTTYGLRRDSPPMRLFEKAKRFGIMNPSDLDFKQDRHDRETLSDLERTAILHLTLNSHCSSAHERNPPTAARCLRVYFARRHAPG